MHGYDEAWIIVNTNLENVIIPVIKNKSGDATDKHNYRPIAISTTMSKVLELLMLHKIDSYLYTTDNQFGFKQNHCTDMCIYALRQTIDNYKRNSSPVFICYVDASKAFDRVNHWCLFKKLFNRDIHITEIRLLVRWYGSQLYRVRWGDLMVLLVRMVLRKEEFYLRGFLMYILMI